jgi:cytochrome P450
MLTTLPRALVARYAPAPLKRLLRHARQRVRRFRGRNTIPRKLFVFSGRTEYEPGIGRGLYAQEPAFRAAIQECERITTQELGGPSIIDNFTGVATPDFFADEARVMHVSAVLQLALVDLWRAQGVRPQAVLGISLGEIAAVYAAGGLSLTDALRVSACYYGISRVEQPDYGILVIQADFATAGRLAATCPSELFIVLVLNATTCFAFCPEADFAAAEQHLAAHGVACHHPVTKLIWAYHATRLARHLPTLRAPLRGLQPLPLTVPCYLTTAGRRVEAGTVLGVEYWLALPQYPVLVQGALGAALADGYQVLMPIGANPFPFFYGDNQHNFLGGAQLLPFLQPDTPEEDTIAATQQALTTLGLLRPAAPSSPGMTAAECAAQLNLNAPDLVADPSPNLGFLRRHGPLHYLPAEKGWLVLDADLINTVLREPLVFSSTVISSFDTELIGADPPLHTTNRTLFQPFFTPLKLAALGEFTRGMVAELAAELGSRPSFDFVTDFAIPLTQAVGAQLLGLTTAERKQLQSRLPGHAYDLEHIGELTRFFEEYFQQRQSPAEEPVMLDQLLAYIRSGQLTQEAALSLAKTMWLAGIATSSMLMSSAAYYLLTHPLVAEQLRAAPELIDAFIEEILRLESPLNVFFRITTQPYTLGGQDLPAGSMVLCSITAANRDPARYPNPDELDLSRRASRHLSFGGGIHACMGAHLARLEARIVVQWLLSQGPALQCVNPAARPNYFPTLHFRALTSLPLTLHPTA